MILGFTGSRQQLTQPQIDWLCSLLSAMWARQEVSELHHGACIGADAYAHMIAYRARIPITVHPPISERYMFQRAVEQHHLPLVTVLPAKPYLDRNRDIVDACDRLIGLPDGPPRPHSGTWFTIRYAAIEAGKPVTICWPDAHLTIDTEVKALVT